MIGASTKVQVNTKPVEEAAKTATYNNLRHAAFSLSKAAKESIEKDSSPSEPGQAPHTKGQRGHNLKGAIFTNVQKESAIIGPRHSFVGDAGALHEFGKTREGENFDERPFMEPALEKSIPRFASDWAGSIGE